jgi:hypothetical protein
MAPCRQALWPPQGAAYTHGVTSRRPNTFTANGATRSCLVYILGLLLAVGLFVFGMKVSGDLGLIVRERVFPAVQAAVTNVAYDDREVSNLCFVILDFGPENRVYTSYPGKQADRSCNHESGYKVGSLVTLYKLRSRYSVAKPSPGWLVVPELLALLAGIVIVLRISLTGRLSTGISVDLDLEGKGKLIFRWFIWIFIGLWYLQPFLWGAGFL